MLDMFSHINIPAFLQVLVEEGGVAWDSKGKGKTCLQITQNSKTKAWLREWGKRQQKGTEL